MKKNRQSKISKPRKPLFYTADPRTSELKFLDEPKKTSSGTHKERPSRKPVMIHSVVADYEPANLRSPQEQPQTPQLSAEPSIKIELAATTAEAGLDAVQTGEHTVASSLDTIQPDTAQFQPTAASGLCCGVTSFAIPSRVDRIHVGVVLPDSFRSLLNKSAGYALTAACNQPGCQVIIASKSAAGATIAILRGKQEDNLTGELNWIAAKIE
ncbi:WIAG-tail domain [Paenibacillus sp. GCM10012307]|uniref:WIAG-tail domain n=1 Tax=Paenibacillus roseus TaxID=2798579 RepID=A0A934J307_9BACL|nr:WIAG-tail domain [Paenibacillus roseus]MBJ6363826.1 WIAG-tail domain [Paenibacillus roseus]